MGSLDLAPSIEWVKSTSIDLIFLVFMSFPVFLCLVTGSIFLLRRNSIVPIPDDGYKMMALGQQQGNLSERSTSGSETQREADTLHVALLANKVVLSEETKQQTRSVIQQQNTEGAFQNDEQNQHGNVVDDNVLLKQASKSISSNTVDNLRNEQEEVVVDKALVVGALDSDEISSDMEMARPERETLQRSDKTTLKQKAPTLHTTSSLWVLSCMIVSLLVVFIGGLWVGAKKENESDQAASFPLPMMQESGTASDIFSELNTNIPLDCFASRIQLYRAISAYFGADLDSKNQLQEQYGPLSDWCVEYIDDFSFLFAERNLENEDLTNWNVSQSQSFSYCFYGSSFDGDLGRWSVKNAWDFSGMFNLAYNFQGRGLSAWDVSHSRNMA